MGADKERRNNGLMVTEDEQNNHHSPLTLQEKQFLSENFDKYVSCLLLKLVCLHFQISWSCERI